MPQPRFFVVLSSMVLLLGTALFVLTSNSKQAKGTATYVGQQSCMSSGCHADFKNNTYQGAGEYKKTWKFIRHKVSWFV